MIDRLYTYIVGGMRVAPSEFWGMTIEEERENCRKFLDDIDDDYD